MTAPTLTTTTEIVLKCRWCRCRPLLVVSGMVVDTVRWRCPKCRMEQEQAG